MGQLQSDSDTSSAAGSAGMDAMSRKLAEEIPTSKVIQKPRLRHTRLLLLKETQSLTLRNSEDKLSKMILLSSKRLHA